MLATAAGGHLPIGPTTEPKTNHHHHINQPQEPAAATASPRVLSILSHVVEKLVARNDRLVSEHGEGGGGGGGATTWRAGIGNRLVAFHGVRPPSISVSKYLERMYKYTNCSPACFVVGYVYMDRLGHKYPDSLVVSRNVHRLLVTCVMVASKTLDDVHYNNAFYAKVGGVSNSELNKLEIELLFLLDFGVTVSSRVFESYCFHLEKETTLNDAVPRIEKTILPDLVALDKQVEEEDSNPRRSFSTVLPSLSVDVD